MDAAETPIERDEAVPDRDDRPHGREASAAPKGGDLRRAMRTARMEDAERSRAIADLRTAELARLDLLREAIEPILAQVPDDVEMFDAGLVPVPVPRLFIDMIAFVEMGRDKRRYRFVQDTRQRRLVLAESDRVEVIRDAVTAYIARRLVEREKALETELPSPAATLLEAPRRPAPDVKSHDRVPRPQEPPPQPPMPPGWTPPPPRRFRWLRRLPVLVLNYLGVVALCVLVWVFGRALYDYLLSLHS